eukprot:GEMP01051075.1.p1 GENE.GEMP01051075.1~~GEMP01051075.1.p1  ORF type:complete len:188 (+),score=33.42 GEMP01051075.1:846-1409(+)
MGIRGQNIKNICAMVPGSNVYFSTAEGSSTLDVRITSPSLLQFVETRYLVIQLVQDVWSVLFHQPPPHSLGAVAVNSATQFGYHSVPMADTQYGDHGMSLRDAQYGHHGIAAPDTHDGHHGIPIPNTQYSLRGMPISGTQYSDHGMPIPDIQYSDHGMPIPDTGNGMHQGIMPIPDTYDGTYRGIFQ